MNNLYGCILHRYWQFIGRILTLFLSRVKYLESGNIAIDDQHIEGICK